MIGKKGFLGRENKLSVVKILIYWHDWVHRHAHAQTWHVHVYNPPLRLNEACLTLLECRTLARGTEATPTRSERTKSFVRYSSRITDPNTSLGSTSLCVWCVGGKEVLPKMACCTYDTNVLSKEILFSLCPRPECVLNAFEGATRQELCQ